MAAEKLLDDNVERIMQRIITMAADEGDKTMLRACFDRLVPGEAEPGRIPAAADRVAHRRDRGLVHHLQGVSEGEITAIEAAEMAMVVRSGSQIASESNLEQRIRKIEETDAAKERSKTP